jgi:hypothetical protein
MKKGTHQTAEARANLSAAKLIPLEGRRFGKLTVIEYFGSSKHHSQWRCKCDCGNECIKGGGLLRTGSVTQCPECSHSQSGKHRTGRKASAETCEKISAMVRARYRNDPSYAANRKLTENQVREIRKDARSLSCLAEIYKVVPSAISRIKSGKSWKRIKG